MNVKIVNGTLLVPDENSGFALEKQDLYIKDGVIVSIGIPVEGAFVTVDAAGQLVMPGLINMHTHAYMNVLKNYADDVPFNEWLFERIMPVEEKLAPEDAYWTSMLACIEMIRSGTTCFMDMHMFKGQSCKAAAATGMRAFIGRGLVGDDLYTDGYSRFRDAIEEKEQFESDRIKFVLSPHAIYSCSPSLMSQVAKEAEKRGMLKQTHLSESVFEVEECLKKHGKTPVKLLSDIGFLDEKTALAHCVQMREGDLDIIHRCGAHIVTNPASNAKLGNGCAPVTQMLKTGINVCLGTDSVASNNTLNMFREMGFVTLLHKAVQSEAMCLPSSDVLHFATDNAAKALGMSGQLGVIKENAKADLIFIDLASPSLFPNNSIITSLCYSANGSEVSSVMIDGTFVMKDRKLLTIDEERVYKEVEKIAEKYL